VRASAADRLPRQRDEIERFVGQLRERPWIDSALVDLIAHGLRTAVRDPNTSLWKQLREVIRDDEELTMADLLEQIGRVTRRHLDHEQARRAAH
jgi:hypothetical protein